MADWKLRRQIKDGDGNVTNTDWPGSPGAKVVQQQRMLTEAAVDITDLNFVLRAGTLTSESCTVYKASIDKTREYDVLPV